MQRQRQVEFADYLLMPTFWSAIDHPQFQHIQSPPEGYIFTQRPGPPKHVGLLKRLIAELGPVNPTRSGYARVDAAMAELSRVARQAVRYGARVADIREFFLSRHPEQNARLPEEADLIFVPSVPYSLCSAPWLVEIEDSTTLFFPYLRNGQTAEVEASHLFCFPILKALLESDSCKAILAHVQSTAESLPSLFNSEVIGGKVVYAPLGIPLPDLSGKEAPDGAGVHLLFTNSWHQDPANFFLRGGHDVLEAFSVLSAKYPRLKLTIRSALPPLSRRHADLVSSHPRIRVLDRFLSAEDLHRLMLEADVYLVPAARVHVVSVLKALSYGIPVVASDGWGFAEYIDEGRTGVLIPGRYGRTSWIDKRNGMYREDYRRIAEPEGSDPQVVAGLVERLSHLIEDAGRREAMGREARRAAETKFTLEKWNGILKSTFDRIFAGAPVGPAAEVQPWPPREEAKTLADYAEEILEALRRGEPRAAEEISAEMIHRHYQDPEGWIVRGTVLQALGDYRGALEALQKSVHRRETPEALAGMIDLYRDAGCPREAREMTVYLRRRFPDFDA